MGCGKTDAEPLEEEKWTQEYETEFQMSEDENKRLKAEIESNKLKAEKSNTSTNSPPQPTGQNSAKAKPVRKLTEEEKKVIGEYEYKDETHVFLENGKLEGYFNGKKMGKTWEKKQLRLLICHLCPTMMAEIISWLLREVEKNTVPLWLL